MIQPLGNRVLIVLLEEKKQSEKKTASGIIVLESDKKEKPRLGKIVAIGKGEKVLKHNLKIGQIIFYGKFAGEDIEVDEKKYKLLLEDEILALQTDDK